MENNFQNSTTTGALFVVSPERVNIQRNSQIYDESFSQSRDSSVHEKVQAFNSLGFQGKQLERKTNDAALKRAMLGREEAESDMRRYREETKVLRRSVDEGRERERRVGERLESIMENYGRAKETHAHTQTLWEKEIRRARKESFKSQSSLVKLQEELKSARSCLKSLQSELDTEKERSTTREQEAFAARYELVGAQEQLEHMLEQIKLVEQERDALRALAKNEEVARIAAEGRLPLPVAQHDDEFASPKKMRRSLSPADIMSSAASEQELDDLRMRLEWSQHLASRAFGHVDFLELESNLRGTSKPEASATIFVPSEGVFRAVEPQVEKSPWISAAKKHLPMPELDRTFARTPSCEPPALAIVTQNIDNTRASLDSLLEDPASPSPAPSSPAEEPPSPTTETPSDSTHTLTQNIVQFHTISATTRIPLAETLEPEPITTTTTTTRIPLANAPNLLALPQSLDPALSPTMSREEALAQIRERRGRARSLAQGTMTPRKQMVEGAGIRRDISAPAVRSAGVRGRPVTKA